MTPSLHAQLAGPEAGPKLLLIHELGGTSASFRWLVPQLPEFRTIAIDLPGAGQSAAMAEGSSIRDYGDEVAAYLRAEVREPAIVVGIAFGAAVGAQIAARCPEAVSGLVFCCMGATIKPETAKFLEDRCLRVLRDGMPPTVDASLEYSFAQALRAGREELFEEYRQDLAAARADGYVNQSRALAKAGTSIGESLQSVSAPAAIVIGRHDGHFSPEAVREVATNLPNPPAVIVIEDAGHFPHVQAPAEFAGVIRKLAPGMRRS